MRDVFIREGRDASLGRYAFGFSWAAWALLLISTILFCLARHKRKDTTAAVAPVGPAATGRSRRTWPWQKRTAGDGRRVKEDYA
jgi:hypothetical protein